MRRTFAIFTMLSLATPIFAQQTAHRFSLYVSGIKAGTINTITTKNGQAFSVSGTLTPTSLMRRIRKVGYSGQSAGILQNSTFRTKSLFWPNPDGIAHVSGANAVQQRNPLRRCLFARTRSPRLRH